ncbi:proline rich transmembrane protein 1B-like [Bufo bufo]|uniref:proline rich transmembrane protein 1B-like n=1 Tax=Bufo bufo TaxID=8384 RepID=UPI001ABDAA8D|nr:proline rich transmembrane protein 1B-like [Bufo bufo]
MENTSFQEPYPSKPGDQPPAYSPGPPVMQPSPCPAYNPSGPDHGVQQTLISQPASTNIVMMNRRAASTRPQYNDYLCWSILNFLFCCWPLGLAAIIYSRKTRRDIKNHDHEAAAKHSRKACHLNVSSFVTGIILQVLLVLYYVYVKDPKEHTRYP